MRTRMLFATALVLMVTLSAAQAQSHLGDATVIESVQPGKRTIVYAKMDYARGPAKISDVLVLSKDARITLDGKVVALEALRPKHHLIEMSSNRVVAQTQEGLKAAGRPAPGVRVIVPSASDIAAAKRAAEVQAARKERLKAAILLAEKERELAYRQAAKPLPVVGERKSGMTTGQAVAGAVLTAYGAWLVKHYMDEHDARQKIREDISKNGFHSGHPVQSKDSFWWGGGWKGTLIKVEDENYYVRIDIWPSKQWKEGGTIPFKKWEIRGP